MWKAKKAIISVYLSPDIGELVKCSSSFRWKGDTELFTHQKFIKFYAPSVYMCQYLGGPCQ